MHACLCLYVCMWVVCVLKPGKIRGSRRQPHGATPPRRRGDGRPPLPSPPYLLTRAGKTPLSPASCRLNPRTLTRSKKEFGGKKNLWQMCGDTQANYRGQRLTWAQSRTIPNYPELYEIHPNGSERFRCHFVFLILAPRMDPRGPLTAHVTRLPA
jgi:hypothetical protein